MTIELAKRGTAAWEEGAALIDAVYDRCYGAKIPTHADELLVVRGEDGKPTGVAGLRDASTGFFSEIYLDSPAENAATTGTQSPVSRTDILEVVTLATVSPLAVLPLAVGVAVEGRRRGMQCCMFTATARLREIFNRAGLSVVELAVARPERVANAKTWGRYYETDPRVCLISDPRAAKRVVSCLRVAA